METGSETGIEIRVSRCCGKEPEERSKYFSENGGILGICSGCGKEAIFDLEHESDSGLEKVR